MKPITICSNMYNEIDEVPSWLENMQKITNRIVIVDSGSIDGTIDFFHKEAIPVIVDDIIRREGYGAARNHLKQVAKEIYPDTHWMVFFDADERILEEEFHQLRFIKDYLIPTYDVVAFPRIDWHDREMIKANNDWKIAPDWQARMVRVDSPARYIRKLHEQIVDCNGIYSVLTNPKINHFHRTSPQEKRDLVGKLCAKLHVEDTEFGNTFPKHHKEDMYYQRYIEEGL